MSAKPEACMICGSDDIAWSELHGENGVRYVGLLECRACEVRCALFLTADENEEPTLRVHGDLLPMEKSDG